MSNRNNFNPVVFCKQAHHPEQLIEALQSVCIPSEEEQLLEAAEEQFLGAVLGHTQVMREIKQIPLERVKDSDSKAVEKAKHFIFTEEALKDAELIEREPQSFKLKEKEKVIVFEEEAIQEKIKELEEKIKNKKDEKEALLRKKDQPEILPESPKISFDPTQVEAMKKDHTPSQLKEKRKDVKETEVQIKINTLEKEIKVIEQEITKLIESYPQNQYKIKMLEKEKEDRESRKALFKKEPVIKNLSPLQERLLKAPYTATEGMLKILL